MRLQDDLDFTTLNWVKQELDDTLKQARQALEAYVEDPADSSLMRFCATYLHQVQGTLRMVELYGAAMVVEEMERVAHGLLDNQIRQKEETYAVLMRGIVQLPDYLERLQGGHKDIPIVLLPLLNDLRACRGEKLVSESVLFSPDLTAPLPKSAAGPDRVVPELELKGLTARLRTNFQTGLLRWIKDMGAQEAIGGLIGTLERLRAITSQEEARRLWWVAAGVLDAVLAGGIDQSPALKQLFGKVDREIKRLADVGEPSFRMDPPRELTKNLLYYVAHSRVDTERVGEIKRTYKLAELLPSEKELEAAKGSLSGRNRALLDTVSAAIKEDLMRVKDALDLYLRTQDARPSDLAAQTEVLHRTADTLGMLGLGVPRRVVQEQQQVLQDISTGMRKAEEGTLLDIAGALLYVEASLDDNVESLGAAADTKAEPASVKLNDLELPQAEVRKILDALMKEAQANLAQAKQDIVAFVESPWDHDKVTQIPRLLEEIAGALRMLDLGEPSQLLQALVKFVEVELIRLKRVPTPDQMDRLADSLASIEYYLEAARDQRSGRDRILDVTRKSLEALGYWPMPADVPETSELADLAGASLEQAPPRPVVEAPAPAPVEAKAPPAPAPVPAPAPAAELDFSGVEVDFGKLTFGTETASGSGAFKREHEAAGKGEEIASVEIPGESVDEYIARMDRGETAAPAPAPEPEAPAPAPQELTSIVEIARGKDVGDLVLGETERQATIPPPPPSEVAGLRFAETVPYSAPVSAAEEEFDWVEIEEEVEVDAPSEAVADSSFQAVPSDDIDDEIREVFVEEVQEEIDNVNRQLPAWKRDVNNLEALKPVRRSFHTLKGSGRLVGAMALGEFSWKIENMLNRVLDKTIQPNNAVIALLETAVGVLPEMLAALRGEGNPKADIAEIMAVADKVAAGEDAWVTAKVPQKVKVKQKRRIQVPRPKPAVPVVAPEAARELTTSLDITKPLDVAPAAMHAAEAAPVRIPGAAEIAAAAGIPVPALDPMLLEILRSEVDGHLATVKDYLREAEAGSTAPAATEPLLRAVHTMHGAVSMAEVPVICDVVGPLEGYVKRLRGQNIAPDAEGIAAIRDAAQLIDQVLVLLDHPGSPMPDSSGSVSARLEKLRDALPEPESPFSVFNLALEEDEELAAQAAAEAAPVAPVEELAAATPVEAEPVAEATAAPAPVLDEASFIDQLILEAETEQAPAAVAEPDEEAITLAADDWEAPTPQAETESLAKMEPASVPIEELSLGEPAEAATIEQAVTGEAPSEAFAAEPVVSDVDAFDQIDALESLEPPVELAAAFLEEPTEAPLAEPAELTAEPEPIELAEPDMSAELAAAFDIQTIEPTRATEPDEGLAAAEAGATLEALEGTSVEAPEAQEAPGAFAEETLEAAFAEDELEAESARAIEAEQVDFEEPREDAIAAFAAETAPSETAPVPEVPEPVAEMAAPAVAMPAAPERAPAEVTREIAPIAEDPDPTGPLDLPDMDQDLIEIFVEEGVEILDKSDALVAKLRENPNAHEAISGLQRHLHTLKGNARAVGLAGIGDLSHVMESLIEAVVGERMTLNRVAVDALERAFDRLHRMVSRVGKRQAIGMPSNMIARFEAIVAGEEIEEIEVPAEAAPVAAAPAPAVPFVPEAAEAAPRAPLEPVVEPASGGVPAPVEPPKPRVAPKPLPEPVAEEELAQRAPQEMIRVRSDLLDALVNFAGEVSIYRSRLEQQMGTFRFNLAELEQTVSRLREQLRKLEIETEAQIIARFQREAEVSHGEFDPLELDRFSTLQQYSRALAESVSDLLALQNALDDLTRQAETLLLQQSRVSSELQEGLMRTRMVPFDSIVPFLRRLLRQTADELGKRAALKIEGAQGEMDRNLLERMKAPFEHMLRNAIAHGIEKPEDRVAAGKPEEGAVRIVVSREATEVVIRVSDDGRGMDREAIRRKAIERGLMRPDAQLSDRDLFGFVLETGFSTAETVSKIAGRGVGMDVVASEIKQLGGSLAIDSQRGKGSTFTIRLPFTLAVTQAIQIRLGESVFAVPMSSVQGVSRIQRDDLERRLQQPHPVFAYAGEEYGIHELHNLLGMPHHRTPDEGQLPLLLTRSGDSRAAVRVDAVMGSREVVVKSAGPQISSVPGVFGATIMGDGSVVMILDLAPLVRRSTALREEVAVERALEESIPGFEAARAPAVPAPVVEERRRPLIMVVDDSITMRKVTSRVLERHDMEVSTAKDGLDAVEKLQDHIPDLMLLDIEMPRMDGYELATYMRNDSRLKHVPIIMITSRTGEKHRQRAFEIGVDRYLGKPYQEADLLKNVEEILVLKRGGA